jgi:hypothetical protein
MRRTAPGVLVFVLLAALAAPTPPACATLPPGAGRKEGENR